jgi:organic hydroperoxide reductase OsmC/OhrA
VAERVFQWERSAITDREVQPLIELETEADIPGIDDATFQKYALDAKQNCPVSKALAGTEIRLNAKLL